MIGGVVSRKYVSKTGTRTYRKKKKFKARFGNVFFLFGKRIFDIISSLLIITLILSWLVPVLSLIIKLESPGPVFFVQTRIGFLGIPFRCYKFRTMVLNEDSDLKQAAYNDSRITRLGHFLRITGLDELPQFFNVLTGTMSLVGPRPFMKKDDLAFSIVVSNYPLRYCVKPGITGMAQVKGYRGRTDNFQSIFHRYQWDAFYVRNARPALDFKILRLTTVHIIKCIFSFKTIKLQQMQRLSLLEPKLVLEKIA